MTKKNVQQKRDQTAEALTKFTGYNAQYDDSSRKSRSQSYAYDKKTSVEQDKQMKKRINLFKNPGA